MRRDPVVVEYLNAGEAEQRQRRAAGALVAGGCRQGDRVAFALSSSADLLCAVLGATRVGIVPVLLNATLTADERDQLLTDAQPSVAVLDHRTLSGLMDGPPVELAPWPLTRAMHYTSGTSGRPKGVLVGTWDDATAKAVLDDEADLWEFSPDDLHLVCSPMYHTVSIRFAGGTLLRGGSVVILNRFDASTARSVIQTQRPTTTFLAPTHLQRLLALPELSATERFDSLRLLVHAGSACPPALKRAAMDRVDPDALWEFYGSTEGQFTVCSPADWLDHPGTVGRARPGRRLSIVPSDTGIASGAPPVVDPSTDGPMADDPTANRSAADGPPIGTIWCEPPGFARFSYWGDPDATALAWSGGAFTVGDVGHLDAEGFLYLSGRRDDLIISGGLNVYPAEVEAVLAEFPGIDEVAVFGLDDQQWGQRVCAAVVATGGITEVELRALAERSLAPYKRPKQYILATDLPHTSTGKLLRRDVAVHVGLVRSGGESAAR